eukprot:Rmarinus@m.16498
MHAVQVKYDCPHVDASSTSAGLDRANDAEATMKQPCADCGDLSENWLCLTCGGVFCSRYVNEHMLLHAIVTDSDEHKVCISFSDLSVWCYRCESYISSPTVQPHLSALRAYKFAAEPESDAGPSDTSSLEESNQKHRNSSLSSIPEDTAAPEVSEENSGPEERVDLLTEARKKELYEKSLHTIRVFLTTGIRQNVIVLTGAGISVAAGIPDFRSPGTGLYDNLQKYNLPEPMSVFDIEYYRKNPEPFCKLAKELLPKNLRPTPVHFFIRLLHEKGFLMRHVTQNIDGLDAAAGVPSFKTIEAHGSFRTAHCLDCKAEVPRKEVEAAIEEDSIPRCSHCQGLVKPDIVFFGEALPSAFRECMVKDIIKADLLIVLGSSLQVMPVCMLPCFLKHVPRVLVNNEVANGFGLNDSLMLGDCQKAVLDICEHCGWKEDLEELMESWSPEEC